MSTEVKDLRRLKPLAETGISAVRGNSLEPIFRPRTVAVIGASENKAGVGYTLLWNLIRHPFGGMVFPVNQKRSSVLGIKAYPNVAAVPERVDLAVIATPAQTVPGVIRECAEVGVPGAIVISAGFKEIGPEGAKLEQEILQNSGGKMRIIGPNCLGVMNPITGLNATFAGQIARPGNVAFVSQSGALCTAILDWSLQENVGFSAFLSIGSMLDVHWGDLIDHLGEDPHTHSILIYMETIGNARAFLSAAREVALEKPIIVIKPGRTEAAAKAAASHTGSLAGSDEALQAAFRRCGILRVNEISELFYMAQVLAKQPRPKGPRLTMVTNAGGPGVLATDGLVTHGGILAQPSKETIDTLSTFLPAAWSHNNPIDILGDADAERYAKALDCVSKDPETDGMLVILTPQAMTDPTQTAERLKAFAKSTNKPLLASWMGGTEVSAGEAILNNAGVPTFRYPDTAAQMFQNMWRYSDQLRALYETPLPVDDPSGQSPQRETAQRIIALARKAGRTLLTEAESKSLLASYNIPTVETRVATTADEAAAYATKIGYPVVLKLHSETITHKTDVGGVRLNLADANAVRQAFAGIAAAVKEKAGAEHFLGVTVQPMIRRSGYELIIGSSTDSQLGPVLLFGTGGQLVEVFKDRALGLPPLNTTLALRMMERTKIYKALQGVRGQKPVDMKALAQLLVQFSYLVVEQPWIKEIDINPLLASGDGLIALDARVVVHGPDVVPDQLPKLAIRPYPTQYVAPWKLKNGMDVVIRPIRPEDEPMIAEFHHTLSEDSVYFRYFHMISLGQRAAHERLARICFNDYDREIALVATRRDAATGKAEILGVGRLRNARTVPEGEFAILITDRVQRQGLGTELLTRLLDIGRQEHLQRIVGAILPENHGMKRICEKLGFRITWVQDENVLRADLNL